jgi:hypothetical protein
MPDYRIVRFRGKFAVTWHDGGKRHRHSLMTDNRAEADQRLARFVAAQAAASRCFGLSASIVQPGKRNFAGRDWRANSGAERGRTAGLRFADRDTPR